jgi:hypothetical protein
MPQGMPQPILNDNGTPGRTNVRNICFNSNPGNPISKESKVNLIWDDSGSEKPFRRRPVEALNP